MRISLDVQVPKSSSRTLEKSFIPIWDAEESFGSVEIQFREPPAFRYEGSGILVVVSDIHYFLQDIESGKCIVPLDVHYSTIALAKVEQGRVLISNGQRDCFDEFVIDEFPIDEVHELRSYIGRFTSKYGLLRRN